jgi:ribosome maturation factor RimP
MVSDFRKEQQRRLAQLIEPLVVEAGVELVELQLVPRKSRSLLRILVDRVGGVTLDECAELSRRVSYILEVENPIEESYTLEVSSPGLDRPLVTPADFRRKVGEQVRIRFQEEAGQGPIEGEIAGVEESELVLKTGDGERRFALAAVVAGHILF